MSNLVDYAKQELATAGLLDKDSDYDGMLGEAALELVEKFSEQGHSGMSALMVTDIVTRLMRYEPLTPLTGEDEEWFEVHDGFPGTDEADPLYQNRRRFSVFKQGDKVYDIDGRVVREKDGFAHTQRVDITFPYTPSTEYVDVD